MCRISFTKAFILGGLLCVLSAQAAELQLVQPMKELFSHPRHADVFKKMSVSCTDCHRFSVKADEVGPLGKKVPSGLMEPSRQVCHQCHRGQVPIPVPQQCSLCHLNTDSVKPADHKLSWMSRHGRMAQMDRDSCTQCHQPQGCSQCHSRRDAMNPKNHPANFRFFHAIQARTNPNSCTECHKSASFCVSCHVGGSK